MVIEIVNFDPDNAHTKQAVKKLQGAAQKTRTELVNPLIFMLIELKYGDHIGNSAIAIRPNYIQILSKQYNFA